MTTRAPGGPANDGPANDGAADFEAALRARRRLLPRFETLHDDEPSPELDRQVLARAREALRLESRSERHYRGPRWAVPVALAATVLLSFGLVMQMDPARNDAVLPPATPVAAADTTQDTADAIQEAAPDLAATPSAGDAGLSARSNGMAAAPAPERRARTFAADPPAREDANPAALARANDETVAAAKRVEADAAAEVAPAVAAEATATAALADAPLPRDDAQRWLVEIERLQRAGELAAARTELDQFRRRYPDTPLPSALERLR